MKALITGGSGFVGQYLVKQLLAEGKQVIAVGQASHSPFDEVVEYFDINLMHETELEAFPFEQVDVVYHLAGLAGIGGSFESPRHYIDINAGIQINLFEACLKRGVSPRIIVVSSGALYDSHSILPLGEGAPIAPSSPYAVSKITQEALGQYYGTRGFEVIIARPFNHIGPGQGQGFLVPDLCQQIAEAEKTGESKIKVGNLTSKRDYTDVRDVVQAYSQLAAKGIPGQVYNVASGRSVSGQAILDQLLSLSSKIIEIEPDADKLRPSDVPDIYGDYTKLHQATGWQPQITLVQTLDDTLSFWRDQA